MPDVRHETDIEAPADRVWETLTDVDRWDAWNPTLYRVKGDLKVGTVLRMRLRIGGPLFMPMRQHILEVSPPSQFRWRSGFGPKWLLSVVRGFRVEPVGEERSRLVQFEKGTGAFAGLVFLLMGRGFRKGYGKIGNALRDRVRSETA